MSYEVSGWGNTVQQQMQSVKDWCCQSYFSPMSQCQFKVTRIQRHKQIINQFICYKQFTFDKLLFIRLQCKLLVLFVIKCIQLVVIWQLHYSYGETTNLLSCSALFSYTNSYNLLAAVPWNVPSLITYKKTYKEIAQMDVQVDIQSISLLTLSYGAIL